MRRFWSKAGKRVSPTATEEERLRVAFQTAGSNFSKCRIEVVVGEGSGRRRVVFLSSEAFFQATLAPPDELDKFTEHGLFGHLNADAFFALGTKEADAAKKVRFWSGMDGVLAKMYANRLHTRGQRRKVDGDECARIFWSVLVAKYEQNPEARRALLATGDEYLLEFVRGANLPGRDEKWGGLVAPDGLVVGRNQMGAMLMRVRTHFGAPCESAPSHLLQFEEVAHGTHWDEDEPLSKRARRVLSLV